MLPRSRNGDPNACVSNGTNWSMCSDPATVPPRNPSFEAVASSWIDPFAWEAVFFGRRKSPAISWASVVMDIAVSLLRRAASAAREDRVGDDRPVGGEAASGV